MRAAIWRRQFPLWRRALWELDTAARRDLLIELQALWNTLGALAAVDPTAPVDVMRDPAGPLVQLIE